MASSNFGFNLRRRSLGTGRELWRSDGTPGDTEPVADVLPGHESTGGVHKSGVFADELWVIDE